MRAFRPRSDDEDGFILVTVLIIIAVLLPLVLAFSSKVQLNLIQAENFRNSLQAQRMAGNGVMGAIGILKADDPTYDSQKDLWASAFPSLAMGEGAAQGVLNVTITDEDGKIPINQLVVDSRTSSSEKSATKGGTNQARAEGSINPDVDARLRNLVTLLGGNPEIIDALIDWTDQDDEPTGSQGAEDEYYRARGYRCKNGPLDSLDELLMIRGFDKELVIDKKMKDYLTVARTERINVNTAPREVLVAAVGMKTGTTSELLSESVIDELDRYRAEGHDFKTLDQMNQEIVKLDSKQLGQIKAILKVNSSYFTVNSRYTIGKVVKSVEALLKRDGPSVAIISWREY
jgi:general secretion pathway protein K